MILIIIDAIWSSIQAISRQVAIRAAWPKEFGYNNTSSRIEMKKKKVHVLGTSTNINPNIQFKDNFMNQKSLKFIGFHYGVAKEHAK